VRPVMRRFLLASSALVVLSAVPLFARTVGVITGHINDPSGAALPAANIFLTNVATNAVRTAVSTDSGDYTFPAVSLGVYNLRVERAAFKTASSNNDQVHQTLRLDFTLEFGQITPSIEVSASAQMFGNVGRNGIQGPGIIGFDAEVHKQIRMPLKEGLVRQFRFEALNVLNHANRQMPTLNVLSGAPRSGCQATAAHQNFGVVSAASKGMRPIQLGLKYPF
jgi:hypothetical protein